MKNPVNQSLSTRDTPRSTAMWAWPFSSSSLLALPWSLSSWTTHLLPFSSSVYIRSDRFWPSYMSISISLLLEL